MNAKTLQFTIPAILVFLVSIWIAFISWTQEPADIFLFPRLVSVFFVILATWNLGRALLGISKVGEALSKREIVNILPGILIMIVLIFWAAKALGFYFASTLSFLAIYTYYDATPLTDLKAWAKRLLITLCFMATIYILFSLVLKVRIPSGMFF